MRRRSRPSNPRCIGGCPQSEAPSANSRLENARERLWCRKIRLLHCAYPPSSQGIHESKGNGQRTLIVKEGAKETEMAMEYRIAASSNAEDEDGIYPS